ncbi:MAG: FAD-binding protein [Calditrichaeota bacterium]|nr:FAD-binding protein [Calditrichota bacterium]
MIKSFLEACRANHLNCRQNIKLSDYTTIRVGGPARFFIEAKNSDELLAGIRIADEFGIPFKILGNGSNVIFSDSGYSGVIIHNSGGRWKIVEHSAQDCGKDESSLKIERRGEDYSEFQTTDRAKPASTVIIRADSGMRLSLLMNELLRHGISGLEWFSGIPATVGGAVYMNIHGGPNYFGNLIHRVALFANNKLKTVNRDYFRFDYDYSILHETGEIIIWAELCLERGNTEKAKALMKKWTRFKSAQPQRSAGCIFQNLTAQEQQSLNLPTPSAGYFIDKVLNLKGYRIGDAVISPSHAAFIENLGKATADEIVRLINYVVKEAKSKTGIDLRLEVELIGDFKDKS